MVPDAITKLKLVLTKYYKDHLYRNSIMIMFNLGTNALGGFFFWIIVARMITPGEVGLATAAISLAGLITTLAGLGMNNSLIRFLPQVNDKKVLFSSILIVNLILAGILTTLSLLLIRLFAPSMDVLNVGALPAIFVLYVLLNSVLSVQNYTLIALRRADLSFIQYIFCVLRIPIVLLISFIGIASIFYSLAIAYIIAIIFGTIVLYLSGISFTFKLDLPSIKKILAYSLGNFTADLFVNAPQTIIPIIIIDTIGAASNAYFYVAYSVCSFLFMIPMGISTSLFVEGSHDLPLKNTTAKAFKLLALFLVPALIIIYLFGNYILLVFNAVYAEKSFDLLKILAFSSIFSSVISLYISALRVNKNIKMINIIYMAYSASIILLGYLLITYYGLIGLGYAWVLSSLFICLFISFNTIEKQIKLVYQRFIQS